MQILSTLMGASFRGKGVMAYIKELPVGTEFYLVPEPDNAYDANAVKVMHVDDDDSLEAESVFCGYLSKESNYETAEWLNQGGVARCTLIDMVGTAKPILAIDLLEEEAEVVENEDDHWNSDDEA